MVITFTLSEKMSIQKGTQCALKRYDFKNDPPPPPPTPFGQNPKRIDS